MSMTARSVIAGTLLGAMAVFGAGAAQAGPRDTGTLGDDIAALHGPFYPDMPATRTANPMQEPVGPDVFRRNQVRPGRPLTLTRQRLP